MMKIDDITEPDLKFIFNYDHSRLADPTSWDYNLKRYLEVTTGMLRRQLVPCQVTIAKHLYPLMDDKTLVGDFARHVFLKIKVYLLQSKS